MTTFYEELCTAAEAQYLNQENKKQAVLRVVRRWTKNNRIIDAALAGNIRLEVLVGPIISPNLRISFFNRENDTLGSPDFHEWSNGLFKQLGNILLSPQKIFSKGYPKDFIDLTLPVKLSQFYEAERHLFVCLGTMVMLWGVELSSPKFLYALSIGAVVGSCIELLLFYLNASFHFRRRRQMARELLQQTRNIDRIFKEASLD